MPKADEGAELARPAVSGAAPHPHSASLRVSLSPEEARGEGLSTGKMLLVAATPRCVSVVQTSRPYTSGVNRIRVAFALSLLLLGACSKERPIQPQTAAAVDDTTPVDGGTVIRRPDASGHADVLQMNPSTSLDKRVAVALAVLVLGSEP